MPLDIRRASLIEAESARLLTIARGGWAEAWNPQTVWIAFHAGEIVATARKTVVGPRNIHIVESVWVREDFRGRRLGLQAIEIMLTQSPPAKLWLDCRPGLARYYAAVGFQIDDRLAITPDYMGDEDPPDQIVMSRSTMVNFVDAGHVALADNLQGGMRMARHTEQPKEIVRPAAGGGDESTFTHPAFGQIRASRVSGHANLYDSDFNHQHYITITISRSELHRSLSRDWHFGKDELVEVSLSEAQWASFVSSMNVGSGVPCTITRNDGQLVPGLPAPQNPAHQFKAEITKTMSDIQDSLKRLASDLDGPMAKTKVSELRKSLELLASRLTGSTGFVADQFDEYVEQTVERAKTEINAYATALVMRTGLDALQGQGGPVLEYLPAADSSDGE